MITRDRFYRIPRTVRDTGRDPYAWLRSGRAAEAEEQSLRDMFRGPPRFQWRAVVVAVALLLFWIMLIEGARAWCAT